MRKKNDARGKLKAEPFSYRRNGCEVVIAHEGKPVTTLRGESASRFLKRADTAEGKQLQLLMAKATGNFKRGNERRGS